MSILLAKRKAQEVLKIFYIKDIYQLDIMSIVGYKEIPVIEKEIKNAEARLQQVEDSGIITINNKISEEGQKRFALAHELGHFELHRGIKSDWLCTEYDMVKRFNDDDKETEANVFAAELLMPEQFFKKDCEGILPGFTNVLSLKEKYKTSIMATAFRYTEIGNHPCAMIVSVDGTIRWFKKSDDFFDKIKLPKVKIDKNSCAGDFLIEGNRLPNKPEKVAAAAWLSDHKYGESDNLNEESLYMPNYKTIVSMIWFD